MSVPEKDISLGHSAPATLQCSQSSNHDAVTVVAELKSYKQDLVPQASHQRSEVSSATKWAQIALEDRSKEGASDPSFVCDVSKSSLGDVLPRTECCGSSLLVQDPDAQSVGRKRSHPISSDDTVMDHSGLEESSSKRSRVCVKDGVMQCLRPQGINGGRSPPWRMAQELSRCLHEPKYQLLLKVVQVLGAEKALELFEETAQIQKDGGKPTAQGNKKKTPGGVFLTLVKTCATAEQKKEIFQVDKEITARRVKEEKKRKANERRKKEHQRELAVLKQKAEWELRIFRAQLGDDFETEQTLKAQLKCTAEEGLVHSEENGILSTPLTSKSKSSNKGETMEVEASDSPDFNNRGRSHQQKHRLKALAEERLAAEEFERMNPYDLDFGIDLA